MSEKLEQEWKDFYEMINYISENTIEDLKNNGQDHVSESTLQEWVGDSVFDQWDNEIVALVSLLVMKKMVSKGFKVEENG